MTKTILVTAAFGTQGRRLVPKLAAAGAVVRALRRKPRPEDLLALGAAEVVIGDLADPDVLREAVAGVDTIYHVGPGIAPKELTIGLAIVDAAVEAGVEHFVFSSVLHPVLANMIHHQLKREIEERLVESGLNFTVLQPADYLQPQLPLSFLERGELELGFSLDRKQAVIDVEDLTDAAANVLLEGERHYGATYELSSENVSARDIVECATRVMRRPVTATQLPVAAFIERFRALHAGGDDPEYATRFLEAMFAWYDTHDFIGNPNVLTMLLGRPPRTVEQTIRALYEAHTAAATA